MLRAGFFTLTLLMGVIPLAGAEPPADSSEFFEARIRPLFVEKCGACHGGTEQKGGLSLESGDALKKGGDSGPLLDSEKPEQSLLLEVVGYTGDIKMPPEKRLSDQEIADIRAWVKAGAKWAGPAPEGSPRNSAASAYEITAEQRQFWSFRPISDPPPPAVQKPDWIQRPLDAYVLAKLEQEGLVPVAAAKKHELLRRVTYDLIGLPPSPEELDAFVNDTAPGAYERVVDRLLGSPRFGERWARFWLDVARYAEDQAHTFDARMYPQGYRYRDWVVRAFNDDLPYDRFVMEQIAGDQLESLPTEQPYDRLLALGYFALGPVYYKDAGCAAKAGLDELDDRVDTLARGFLGLTVACARCHDHKFDPIPQTDYYALAGIFQSSTYREAPLAPPDVIADYDKAQGVVKEKEAVVTAYLQERGRKTAEEQVAKIAAYLTAVWKLRHPPAGQTLKAGEIAKADDLKEAVLEKWIRFASRSRLDAAKPVAEALALDGENGQPPVAVTEAATAFQKLAEAAIAARNRFDKEYDDKLAAAPEAEKSKVEKGKLPKEQADLLEGLFGRRGPFETAPDQIEKMLGEDDKRRLKELKDDVEVAKRASPPMYPQAHSLAEGTVANMKLHVRGNPNKTAGDVPRGFLSILQPPGSPAFQTGSGRLELARAIASPENPLTARVIVNRIWQQHFGKGIVRSPSNFGALGERPSHPELLDHLASQFIAHGWSLKWLHREIVLSATYQASARPEGLTEEQAQTNTLRDPDNQWLWKANRRRLEVEAWRDGVLTVAGRLDPTLGGPSVDLKDDNNRRRTLYAKISRHNLDGFLRLFDFPDPNITSDQRTVVTVPLQQLFVLNSEFVTDQSKALAARLREADSSDPERIRAAFKLLYGRDVRDEELALGLDFLAQPAEEGTKLTPWEQYAQVLFLASEFAYVD